LLDHVKYYSKDDMSYGINLKNAGEFLDTHDLSIDISDINTIIELYNIKKFIDDRNPLDTWDKETWEKYIRICKSIPGIIGRFFSKATSNNIYEWYVAVDIVYKEDFWEIIANYESYRQLSNTTFYEIIQSDPHVLRYITQQKKLIHYYGKEIAEVLANEVSCADLVFNWLLKTGNDKEIFLPEEFDEPKRINILEKYLEWDKANPNYLKLIYNTKKIDGFPITDKHRLKAKKKYYEYIEAVHSRNGTANTFMTGIKVNIGPQEEPIIIEKEQELIYRYSYSSDWIESNLDFPTLLNNFIYLFQHVDRYGRCTFPAVRSELGVFEVLINGGGKRKYDAGLAYVHKNHLASLQMQAYVNILRKHGIEIESLFKWFFEKYLLDEFNVNGFYYCAPSVTSTTLEKNLLLISQMDAVVKQYNLLCEDGYIDRELVEISSKAEGISNTASCLNFKKYIYAKTIAIQNEASLVFSDQSILHHTEKTGGKYDNLPMLLVNENMKIEDFYRHCWGHINWLIERKTLYFDSAGFIRVSPARSRILKDLFHNEVIAYSYLKENVKKEVDTLIATGELEYETQLFSQPEKKYINYMLNTQQFDNGPEIRNRYAHGTHSLDEKVWEADYMQLLNIMVLIIIKINEELCLKYPE